MSAISQGQPKQLDTQIETTYADNGAELVTAIETIEPVDDNISVRSSSSSNVSVTDIRKTEQLIEQSRLEDEYENAQSQQEVAATNTVTFSVNIWAIAKKSAINLILPFINGMMLGFGEILAHEIGFRYNWVGAKVQPVRRLEKKNESKFL